MKLSLNTLAHWLETPENLKNIDIQSISINSQRVEPGALFIAIQGENFDGHNFIEEAKAKGAVAAIISKPVQTSLPTIMADDTRIALGKIAKKWREQYSLPVIAVTGSCGKTTTKGMIANILQQAGNTIATEGNLNNDIGLPLTLLKLTAEQQYAVFELGANHLGEIQYLTDIAKPRVSLITNAGAAHLEGFGNIEGVAREKSAIYQGLDENGTAILNIDDNYADFWKTAINQRKTITFSLSQPADFYAKNVDLNLEGQPQFILVTPTGELPIHLPLVGAHQVANALAAAAACFAVDISLENIKKGLESLPPISKRWVIKKGLNGATVIDDSYNANPLSMHTALQALSHYPGERICILGDMGELGETAQESHRELGHQAKKLGIDRLYAVGNLSRFVVEAFGDNAQHFPSKSALIAAIKGSLKNNMTILIKGSFSAKMEEIAAALTGN